MSVVDAPGNGRNSYPIEPRLEGRLGQPPLAQMFQEIRHDAMQSISAILMVVAAGKEEATDPALVRRRLDQVAEQTRSLADLIDDAAAVPLASIVVDVSSEASQIVRALTAGYGGTIGLVATSGAWAALSPASLRRVLTNLLLNAMRAAGEAGVVQVRVVRSGGRWVVEVEDDGPGFGRLEVINGVGLRSARRLLSTAGGTIEVATGPTEGTVVRVSLPAVEFDVGDSCEDPAV